MADRTYTIGLKVDADTGGFSKMAGAASAMSSKVAGEVGKIAGSLDKLGAGKIRINFDASNIRSQIAGLNAEIAKLGKGAVLDLKTTQLAEARAELGRINDAIRQLQSAGGKLTFDTSGIAQITGDIDKLTAKARELGSTRAKLTVETDSSRALSDLDKVTNQMRQLDGERVEVLLSARDDARETIIRVDRALHEVDGYRAEAYVTLRDEALNKLDKIEAELNALEGRNVSVTLTARDQLSPTLDRVNKAGGQARNVLGNMVGNAAQDLGQLAGMGSTAGVAIGQMAEYAADGSINLKQMAGLIGPMLAIGGAITIVSNALADTAKKAADTKKYLDGIFAGIREGQGAVTQLREQLESVGRIEMPDWFSGRMVDVTANLDAAGVSVQQFGTAVQTAAFGGLEKLRAAMEGAGVEATVVDRVMLQAGQTVDDYASQTEKAAMVTRLLAEDTSRWVDAASGFEARAAGIGGTLTDQAAAAKLADQSITHFTGSLDQFSSVGATFGAQISPALGEMTNKFTEAQNAAREAYDAINLVFDQDPASVESAVAGLQQYHSGLFGLQTIAGASATALDGMSASLQENGDSFDVNTEAGRANQQALEGLAGSTIPTIAANYDAAGGSLENFAASQVGANAALRQSLVDAGVSADTATRIANQLMPLDGLELETQWRLLIEADAEARLAMILPMLDSLALAPDIEKKIALMILGGASPQEILDEINAGIQPEVPIEKSVAVVTEGGDKAQEVLSAVALTGQSVPAQVTTTVSTPGAPASTSQLKGVTAAAGTVPESEQVNTSAPGATQADSQLDGVTSSANSIPASKNVSISASDHATGTIDAIKRALSGIQSKTVSVNVNTNYTSSGGAQFTSGGGVFKRAGGGKVGANERMTLVGERGPEFVSLPSGSFVHTAPQTRRMASAAAASGMVGMAGGGQVYGATPSGGSLSDPHNWRGISMLLNDRRPGKPPDNLTPVGGSSRGTSSGSSLGGGDVNVNFYGPVSTDSKAELARYLEHRLRAVQLGQMAGSRH